MTKSEAYRELIKGHNIIQLLRCGDNEERVVFRAKHYERNEQQDRNNFRCLTNINLDNFRQYIKMGGGFSSYATSTYKYKL